MEGEGRGGEARIWEESLREQQAEFLTTASYLFTHTWPGTGPESKRKQKKTIVPPYFSHKCTHTEAPEAHVFLYLEKNRHPAPQRNTTIKYIRNTLYILKYCCCVALRGRVRFFL